MVQYQESRLARWAEHFKGRFSWSTAKVRMPVKPATEPMQADNSPPSEIEVVKGIGFLGHWAAGPAELRPLSFKDGGS